ncbi:MSHA biogenesis protein MshK [Vibrio sp. ZSDE26]|uniref:MSHA biogenesis protein MshK n=1 Tax=Vibrio amylolyticus TaxID=2847292 RepID=A0A9X1XFY3_9VIBR|nr:MSHA biogenesis protein MshK [Vibrio amylolyticus]MCK6262259.1 MSHA biogenesis protein MshK [Vibrio amylolyticus]
MFLRITVIAGFLFVSMFSSAADKQPEGQDPTAPLGWEKPAESKSTTQKTVIYRLPTLKSIACDQTKRCNAVLNNTVVKKGDKLNGYQVRQISDDKVTLVRGSRLWTLELFSLDIKN